MTDATSGTQPEALRPPIIAVEHVFKSVTDATGTLDILRDIDFSLAGGETVAIVGASGSGKSTLLSIIAGLDVPTRGTVRLAGQDLFALDEDARAALRARQVGFVFQSFQLLGHLTALENVMLPLEIAGRRDARQAAAAMLDRVGLAERLGHYPRVLSGGEQQRVALARALAKGAPLMLLDEPLVNLDYKLREELREELTALFAAGDTTVVYATTEPGEALLLGGHTAVLDAGELLQVGPTAEVFHRPASLRVARAFSDPPMNLIAGSATAHGVQLRGGPLLPLTLPAADGGPVTLGARAAALHVTPRDGDVALPGRVELAEISGSDTYVHVETAVGELVAQLTGVRRFELGDAVTLYLHPTQAYVFDGAGALRVAPPRIGQGR